MSASMSTQENLLSVFEDLEIITKQIFENALSAKNPKVNGPELVNLNELLIAKDEELRKTTELAEQQAKIEKITNTLKDEVEIKDQYIRQLEKQLKEAEQLLATANYQAGQKLHSIDKANQRPVSSEDLIKYAHRISSSEAVCAPLTWQPGDHRRPYPTEIDMRLGLLMRYNDSPINGHMIQQPSNLHDIHRGSHGAGAEPPVSIPNQFAWHPSADIHMSVPNQGSVPIETRNHKDPEDVEVMSTDSSSSSSSDSQ